MAYRRRWRPAGGLPSIPAERRRLDLAGAPAGVMPETAGPIAAPAIAVAASEAKTSQNFCDNSTMSDAITCKAQE
jgi:hypothetical protein